MFPLTYVGIFDIILLLCIGVWLSLVERDVRDVEAAGSNPVTPKKKKQGKALLFLFRRERFYEEANASGQEDEEIQQKRNDHLTGFAEGEHRAGIESSHKSESIQTFFYYTA